MVNQYHASSCVKCNCYLKTNCLFVNNLFDVVFFFKRLAAKLENQFIKTSNVDLVSNLIILLTLRAFVSQNNVLLSIE